MLDGLRQKWCEDSLPKEIGIDAARNLVSLLSLMLTSTERAVRDRATRALVRVGELRPEELFKHTIECLGYSDPYVPERMLAASFGVAMSKWAIASTVPGFSGALVKLAITLIEGMLLPKGKFLTSHALMRDYAEGIIFLARRSERGWFKKEWANFLRRPVLGIPDIFPSARRIKSSYCEKAKSAIAMDFGNYTIGRLLPNRANYDYKDPKYIEVRKKIDWRILNLGYEPDLFKRIDEDIARQHFYRQQREGASRIDRYGKKYSWIAFYEMQGFLEAVGKLRDRPRYERLSDADVDPSFPRRPTSWEPVLHGIFENSPREHVDWLRSGGVPNYDHLLRRNDVSHEGTPAVLLDGYVSEEDPSSHRRVFTFLRGLFVDPSKLSSLRGCLERVSRVNIPDIGADYYTFAGEIPWSPRFAYDLRDSRGGLRNRTEEALADSRTEERVKRLKKVWKVVYETLGYIPDYSPVVIKPYALPEPESKQTVDLYSALDSANRKVPARDRVDARELLFDRPPSPEEVALGYQKVTTHRKLRGVPVRCASWRYNWESYHSAANDFSGFLFPSPHLCSRLKLRGADREIDLFDEGGRPASFYRESEHGHFLFLRRDLLDQYLEREGLAFVWIIWGERQLRFADERRWVDDDELSELLQARVNVHKRAVIYAPAVK